MAGTLYLRLSAMGDRADWLVQAPDGFHRAEEGPVEQAAARAAGLHVVVFVPSTDVLLTHAEVPTQQRQRMLRAIPYALEEQLAADVESQHFALGPSVSGGVATAVVSRERMGGWVDKLHAAGLHPHVLQPDVLALPFSEGTWTLLLEDDQILLRTGLALGHAIDPESLSLLLPLAFGQAEARPERLRVLDCRSDQEELPDSLEGLGVEVQVETCSGGVLKQLAPRTEFKPVINLLQGDYSRREQLGKLWRPWRAAAAMLLALLILQGGLGIYEYWTLRAEANRLSQQIEQVYRSAFPEARNIVNPKVQMERALAALKGGSGSGTFTSLLTKAAPIVAAAEGVNLGAVRYKEGRLEVDLTLGDFQALDRLNQNLTKSGLQVTIDSANAGGNKVQGRLKIAEATR